MNGVNKDFPVNGQLNHFLIIKNFILFEKKMSSRRQQENSLLLAIGVVMEPYASAELKLTPSDFANLNIDTSNGRRPLFTPSTKSCAEIIELAGMFKSIGVQKTYEYLVNHVIPKLQEMSEVGEVEYFSVLTFDSPLLEHERRNEEAMHTLNDDRGPLTDITPCVRCGAPKVHKKMQQTRSADEGMTAIYTCPVCKYGWTEG